MKKAIGILVLIIIGVAYWIFSHNTPSPSIDTNSTTSTISPTVLTTNSKVLALSKDRRTEVTATPFMIEVQKCFPRMKMILPTDQAYTMKWVDEALPNLLGARERSSLDWMNIHYKLHNGDERRIRIVEELTIEDKSFYQVELYKLDREGYPEKIRGKGFKQSKIPSDTMINKIIGDGDISYHENSFTDVYPNSNYVKRTVINDNISELEIHTQGRVLKCENSNCECIL